ncbi:LOW QUALITY PROTEIN: protein inturned [Suncus etruscus]|uniref:LOW QUALITY PROTEIN: protein inturned n=1 Tax=Suncus etruscus TaxID=109475 RepID=UPI00210FED69|nr:LOW QUALITY PROTEIN: protein inturned [Suncus etruscus]
MASSAQWPSPPRGPEQLPGYPASREEKEDDSDSDSEARDSASCTSDGSEDNDLEPEWLSSVQKRGELFYLELDSDSDADVDSAPSSPTPGRSVRFSEDEVIIMAGECERAPKGPAGLRCFTRALRSRGLLPRRAPPPPVSILKPSPEQRGALEPPRWKEVTLHVHPRAPVRRHRHLEVLLGIVHRSSRRRPGRLQVHGLQPGGPALKSGQVLIGDILVAVNDVQVSTENIEQVLACIPGPMQVKLTFENAQVAKITGSQEHPKPVPTSPGELVASPGELVQLLQGDQEPYLGQLAQEGPHVVMFLSLQLDSDTTKDEQEVLYLYPPSDTARKLKSVRGIFLTLSDMLETVTGTRVTSSSLILDGKQVHAAYWKEAATLLVVCMPASQVPLAQLRSLTEAAVRTLCFMFGSLESAFSQAEPAATLDHFFALFFQRALQPTTQHCGAQVLDTLPGARWLPVHQDLKVELDLALSDLEAADFEELSEDHYDMRRLYTIVGTSLFYKGHLFCSHLPRDDLLAITGYCQHVGLLALGTKRRVGQLVVWREVFPLRPTDTGSDPDTLQPPDNARCFLLIVGLGGPQAQNEMPTLEEDPPHPIPIPPLLGNVHETRAKLLVDVEDLLFPLATACCCVLLEGWRLCVPGHRANPGPDCVYVDQPAPHWQQLQPLEAAMDQQLAAAPHPALSCADGLLAGPHDTFTLIPSPILRKLPGTSRTLSPTPRRVHFADFPTKARRPQPIQGHRGALTVVEVLKGQVIGCMQDKCPPQCTMAASLPPSVFLLVRLTSGPRILFFHYLALETMQGVLVTPTHEQVSQLGGTVHPQLLQNFHRCCLSIRAVFQQALANEGERGEYQPQPPRIPGCTPVKEHGLLFECSPDDGHTPMKDPPVLTYWVVGKLFLQPKPRELYVCFHDSVTELAMEMAFKLFFALTL